jgi:hypothetical protein
VSRSGLLLQPRKEEDTGFPESYSNGLAIQVVGIFVDYFVAGLAFCDRAVFLWEVYH